MLKVCRKILFHILMKIKIGEIITLHSERLLTIPSPSEYQNG